MAVPERPGRVIQPTALAPESLGLSCRHLAYIIYTSGSTGESQRGNERASRGGQSSAAG
ncbi:hypothetical protein P4S72_11160 [Vibrio sp. PP-XX7]